MAIQWFPGHMHKARTEMAAALSGIDLILEVRDARIPASSANPMLHEMLAGRTRLCVLSREDLANPEANDAWLDALQEPALLFDPGREDRLKTLQRAIREAARAHQHRHRPTVLMVVGIPNVGKSTLINALAGRKAAQTGNEPAVTRRQQDIVLEPGLTLRDTPGVLWPRIDNPAAGYRLAITGAVRETALDFTDIGMFLMEHLAVFEPEALRSRWPQLMDETLPESGFAADPASVALETWSTPGDLGLQLLEAVGRETGAIGSRGLVDLDRAARTVVMDFRQRRLGQLSLETPKRIEAEHRAVAAALIEKQDNKTKRVKRRR